MSSFPPAALRDIIQEIATLLKERKETISVAETVLPLLYGPSVLERIITLPGRRRSHFRRTPLLPRRLRLLQRRPDPLHP
jgi:hypothetical protein